MYLQELGVARRVVIEIVSKDVPEVGIRRASIFSTYIAGVGVDVKLDHPPLRLKGAHSFQRGAARRQQLWIAGRHCTQEYDHAVAGPYLGIAGGGCRGAKPAGSGAGAQHLKSSLPSFVYQDTDVHVAPSWNAAGARLGRSEKPR
jgi:hypothetical protein